MGDKSLASTRIKVILDKKQLTNVEIVRRIRENSTHALRNVCNINLTRLEEILKGDKVTLEDMAQVLY
mgnify:CR=1 FL=1